MRKYFFVAIAAASVFAGEVSASSCCAPMVGADDGAELSARYSHFVRIRVNSRNDIEPLFPFCASLVSQKGGDALALFGAAVGGAANLHVQMGERRCSI